MSRLIALLSRWFEDSHFWLLALLRISGICEHCDRRGVVGARVLDTRNGKKYQTFALCHYCDHQFYFYEDGTIEEVAPDHPDYLNCEEEDF